jgi:Flp pilus assembly protein protease CpaA
MFLDSTTVLLFVFGVYLAHLADVLAEAWHKEGPVFRKGAFLPFVKEIASGYRWWPLLGRKRSLFQWLPEVLVCGGLTIAFYLHYGWSFMFGLMVYVMFAFTVALISDMKWREIPHEINHLTALLAVIFLLIGKNSVITFLLGAVPVVILFSVGFVMYLIRPMRGFGIGGGDLRFIFSMGLLMGMPFATLLMTLGCASAVLLALPTLIRDMFGKAMTYIPMMAGFSAAYILMILGHYLLAFEDDWFPMLDFLSIAGVYLF